MTSSVSGFTGARAGDTAAPGTADDGDSVEALSGLPFLPERAEAFVLAPPGGGAVRTCIVLLAALATLAALRLAAGLLIPFSVAVVLGFALNPAVQWLQRRGLPRAAGAAIVVSLMWGVGSWLIWALQDDAARMAAQAPVAAERIAQGLESVQSRGSAVWSGVRDALVTIERAANDTARAEEATPAAGRRSALQVQVESSVFQLRDFLRSGSAGVAALFGQLVVVSFLAYFLLGSGQRLKRAFVQVAGGSLTQRKRHVRLVSDISSQIQYQLLVLAGSNALLGVLIATAYAVMGIEQPVLWGAIAFVVHFVPYFGVGTLTSLALVFVQLQTGSWQFAFAVAAVTMILATAVGTFLMTWLQSRAAHADPAVIFGGLVLFGWLWGLWGMLLGAPLIAIVRVICRHVDGLRPVAVLIEGGRRRRRGGWRRSLREARERRRAARSRRG